MYKQMYDARISVCKNCEHFNSEQFSCRECGCFLKFKGRIPFFDCPIRKWPKNDN